MKRDLLLFPQNRLPARLFLTVLLAVFAICNSFAQGRTVSGTVTAADEGTAIPGANVIIKGTSRGTVTDVDGKFSITVSDNAETLVISSIGYASQEIVVGDRTNFSVNLAPDIQSLAEVVVIGYGTQERKDVSGAIASVTAAQIEKVPVSTLDQALQGRSPGVQVTNNDGSPGAGITVQIRGTGSFGDNTPLYVVDGYPISGSLNTLNPNDIASMEILKDASATAIYGSRAANGVVIITTKRGKKEGIQVSLDVYSSIQMKPKQYDVLNAQQFTTFASEIAAQESYPVLPEWSNPSSLRNIDWQKELYQTGNRQNYNISLRGGSEKVQTAFSVGYLKQKGIVKLSDFSRYNATLNLDYTPNTWLKASASVKYTRTGGAVRFGSGQNGVGNLTKLVPTMTGNPLTDEVKDANGNYGYYTKNAAAVAGQTNILADIETQDRQNANNNLLASAYLEVTLVKGLKVKTNFGINSSDYSGYYFTPTNSRVEPAPRAYYSQSANNTIEWLWENTVSYSMTFNDHAVDFVGGVSAQENKYRQIGLAGYGLVSDELRNAGSLESITDYYGNQQIWSLASEFARLTYKFKDKYILTGTVRRDGSSRFGPGNKYGVFPSVAAAWKIMEEPFMANVPVLSDLKLRGSWGQTGNQNIALFQYQGTYGSGTSLVDNRGYVFGVSKTYYDGLALESLPNPDLKWEATTQSNVGIDAAFLEGKVTLTADYYNKVSSDFLLDIDVPSQTGFSKATRNVGSIKNNGLELALGYRQSTGVFQWGVTANITTVHNKIQRFADGLKAVRNFTDMGFANYGSASWTVFSQSEIGGQVGSFYGFKSAGIFQAQSEIDALNAEAVTKNGAGTFYQSSATAPGDRKFADLNGDGRITDDDRAIIGSPIPKFYGGLNFDGTYKQFDFSMFWYFSYGNDILNYARRNLESLATNGGVGIENVGEDFYKNRWTETNHSTTMPRAVRNDVSGNTRVSDAYVEDGSYIRLRNIQIGYTFPVELSSKISLTKARVYISAQNLFTITKYTGLDPEIGQVTDPNAGRGTANPNAPVRSVQATGLDVGNFPNSRFYTLGLSLQF